MKRIYQTILNTLFPLSCVLCGLRGALICPDCEKKLPRVGDDRCSICGIPFAGNAGQHPCSTCLDDPPQYDRHRSLFVFNDEVKKIIHGLKYHEQFWVKQVVQQKGMTVLSEFSDVDCLVPIPLHTSRLKKRGYNQSVLLAETMGRILKKPVLIQALKRVKDTLSQTGLKKKERYQNLRGAFSVDFTSQEVPRKILLVDDVHTTGVTLSVAAGVLKKIGVKDVCAVTMAIVK